jgi:chloramphenicol 3-O-phosphotransferase
VSEGDEGAADVGAVAGRGGGVAPGWVVVLNGPPRSGKSSIADAIQ